MPNRRPKVARRGQASCPLTRPSSRNWSRRIPISRSSNCAMRLPRRRAWKSTTRPSPGCCPGSASHTRKVAGRHRALPRQREATARRLGQASPAGDRRLARPRGISGRDGGEDEPHAPPRPGAARRAADHGCPLRQLGHANADRGADSGRTDRALGDQGRDGWDRLRRLRQQGAGARDRARHRRHPRQSGHPQERRGDPRTPGPRLLVALPAALLARPHSHRTGLLKAHGSSPKDRRTDLHRAVRRHRRDM